MYKSIIIKISTYQLAIITHTLYQFADWPCKHCNPKIYNIHTDYENWKFLFNSVYNLAISEKCQKKNILFKTITYIMMITTI